LQDPLHAIEKIMKLQALFVAIVFFTAPLIWRVPVFWKANCMAIITLLVLFFIAPLSVLIMLLVAYCQWLIWEYDFFKSSGTGFIITCMLPLLPLIFYKAESGIHHWLIPVGLSFYSFRQVHVAFECYKGQMQKPSLISYLQYLLFLPVMLIGPIHRMPEFLRSLRRMKWNADQYSEGLERILYGLVKIKFLGNFLCSMELFQLAHQTHHFWFRLYLEVVAFTGNAYFQFAGFSDLAIGAGLLWGIRVMENFNAPFMATNMQEFWRRWHISLSTWCRDYVFNPLLALGRNRWIALICAMLVLALWHEISLRYIVWGTIQALLILMTVVARKRLPALSVFINQHPAGRWIGRIWVFHLFSFSCIFIASESISSLSNNFKHLFF
jgi:alginate O-acetyltransferase complex protein AlgI